MRKSYQKVFEEFYSGVYKKDSKFVIDVIDCIARALNELQNVAEYTLSELDKHHLRYHQRRSEQLLLTIDTLPLPPYIIMTIKERGTILLRLYKKLVIQYETNGANIHTLLLQGNFKTYFYQIGFHDEHYTPWMIKAVFYLLENVIPVIRAVVSKGHIGLTTEKMKICWKISMGGYFGGEYSEEKLLKHLSEQQITVFSGIEGVIWKECIYLKNLLGVQCDYVNNCIVRVKTAQGYLSASTNLYKILQTTADYHYFTNRLSKLDLRNLFPDTTLNNSNWCLVWHPKHHTYLHTMLLKLPKLFLPLSCHDIYSYQSTNYKYIFTIQVCTNYFRLIPPNSSVQVYLNMSDRMVEWIVLYAITILYPNWEKYSDWGLLKYSVINCGYGFSTTLQMKGEVVVVNNGCWSMWRMWDREKCGNYKEQKEGNYGLLMILNWQILWKKKYQIDKYIELGQQYNKNYQSEYNVRCSARLLLVYFIHEWRNLTETELITTIIPFIHQQLTKYYTNFISLYPHTSNISTTFPLNNSHSYKQCEQCHKDIFNFFGAVKDTICCVYCLIQAKDQITELNYVTKKDVIRTLLKNIIDLLIEGGWEDKLGIEEEFYRLYCKGEFAGSVCEKNCYTEKQIYLGYQLPEYSAIIGSGNIKYYDYISE